MLTLSFTFPFDHFFFFWAFPTPVFALTLGGYRDTKQREREGKEGGVRSGSRVIARKVDWGRCRNPVGVKIVGGERGETEVSGGGIVVGESRGCGGGRR